MASEALANPWAWLGLAAFLLGLSLAEGVLWLLALVGKRGGRARSLASALAGTALALALLAVVGLLVLPPKPALAGILKAQLVLALTWAGACLVLGGFLALMPRLAGGLILALGLGLGLAAGPGLGSWLPATPSQDLARLLPLGQGGDTWSCELVLYGKGGENPGSSLDIPSGRVGLVVETLDFSGPASILHPRPLCRARALVAEDGKVLTSFEDRGGLFDLVLPLPPGPGPARVGGLVGRARLLSPSPALRVLEPILYGLREAGEGQDRLEATARPGP